LLNILNNFIKKILIIIVTIIITTIVTVLWALSLLIIFTESWNNHFTFWFIPAFLIFGAVLVHGPKLYNKYIKGKS